ncbi:ATP-binding protein [Andreprevotia chitinilytica]|uniref:ATP-binding protein n=1 Tax=Andreprevotia chitinilytica TaxID=396808 RepID=UPI0005520A9B|nr:ATP-binding protein [Andreprevotia chitinilytica]
MRNRWVWALASLAFVAGLALMFWLLWLSASAAVFSSEYSFRRLMSGPGYLIAESLKRTPKTQWQNQLDALSRRFQYPVALVERADIELAPEADTMLAHGQGVQSSDEEIYYYPLTSTTLIKFGPMWGTASVGEVLRTPVYWFTALAAVVPSIALALLWFRQRRRQRGDITAVADVLHALARDPAIVLPATSRPLTPLVHALKTHAAQIALLADQYREVSHAISHELRTPLARMRFALALLERSEDDATRSRLQERLNKDVAELEALVRASLSYARLANAPATLIREQIQVGAWLREELDLQNAAERVALQIAPEDLQLTGDRALLHMIVRNLLSNALRHATKAVQLSAQQDGECIVLTVDDDGPGIPPSDRARIFEPFVRLTPPQADADNTGFGLGLALVKRAVHWHHGQIEVAHSPLGGARFTVVLPIALP